jgi:hypothetical protein
MVGTAIAGITCIVHVPAILLVAPLSCDTLSQIPLFTPTQFASVSTTSDPLLVVIISTGVFIDAGTGPDKLISQLVILPRASVAKTTVKRPELLFVRLFTPSKKL